MAEDQPQDTPDEEDSETDSLTESWAEEMFGDFLKSAVKPIGEILELVITSYSIHYTKLYEQTRGAVAGLEQHIPLLRRRGLVAFEQLARLFERPGLRIKCGVAEP